MREDDPYRGRRLLILGKVIPERKTMHISIVESELKEMGFEIRENFIDPITEGWFLNTWEATASRVDKAAIEYVKTGKEHSKSVIWQTIRENLEIIPGVPELTKLEEVEIAEIKKLVKTSSTAKKFGI